MDLNLFKTKYFLCYDNKEIKVIGSFNTEYEAWNFVFTLKDQNNLALKNLDLHRFTVKSR